MSGHPDHTALIAKATERVLLILRKRHAPGSEMAQRLLAREIADALVSAPPTDGMIWEKFLSISERWQQFKIGEREAASELRALFPSPEDK